MYSYKYDKIICELFNIDRKCKHGKVSRVTSGGSRISKKGQSLFHVLFITRVRGGGGGGYSLATPSKTRTRFLIVLNSGSYLL